MSDILSLGASGVQAYQRALVTVSNNIANVATEGYSRQEIGLDANASTKRANDYFGTGVTTTNIQRQYDAFVESNLRRSISDLEGQGPLVQYTNRVIDLMADETVGLSAAMTSFFNASRDLAAQPASLITRNLFLRGSEGVASGFRLLMSQLGLIDDETKQGLESASQSVNTLAGQIALVNRQLGKNALLERQPSELLDQRDRLLRKLSELVQISTRFSENGEVMVSLTDNFEQGVVVERDTSQFLSLAVNEATGRVEMIVNPNSQTKRQNLGSLVGGQIGSYLAFREQVLQPTRAKLNELASAFLTEVNAVHRDGIDLLGRPGEDLFGTLSGISEIAQAITLRITDAEKVAAASPFRVVAEPLNVGRSLSSVTYTPQDIAGAPLLQTVLPFSNSHPDYSYEHIVGGRSPFPIATIPQGTANTVIYMDPDGDQQLNILTRDGRHLLGQALTPEQYTLAFESGGGLLAGAQYSSAYLNQTDPELSYLGMSYFLGARAQPITRPVYDAPSGLPYDQEILPAILQSDRIDPALFGEGLAAGALTLNGVEIPEQTSIQGLVDWINENASNIGDIKARLVNDVRIGNNQIIFGATRTLTLNGEVVLPAGNSVSSISELATQINTKTADTGVVATISDAGELVLSATGGRTIQVGVVGDNTEERSPLLLLTSTYHGRLELQSSNNTQSIALGFGSGNPADLEKLGFRTGAYIDGVAPEDLLVFVANAGTAKITAQYQQAEFDIQAALRAAPLTIRFGADNFFTITDDKTGTQLARRAYDPSNAGFRYQGLTFSFNTLVRPGDTFYLNNNVNGAADNGNIIRLGALEGQRIFQGNTLTEGYIDQTRRLANVAQQATIAQSALTVVNQQAVLARDAIVGVNLDREAADLIRFQQAYQANAKVIQVANSLFDTLLQST